MIIVVWISISIIAVVFVYVEIPLVYRRCARFLLERRAIKSKTLVLTFDDGPGNRLTPAILNILSKYHVKATFFLLGRNIIGRENLVKRITAEGHDICSHGYDHLHAWRVWPWNNIRDIQKGWKAIDQALGAHKKVYHYRPPYGKLNLVTLVYLFCKRVPIIYWTVDSHDTWSWKSGSPSYQLLSKRMSNGGVLLVHDFDRFTDERDQYVLDVIKLALDMSQNNNLRICTLSQMESLSL